RASEAVCRALAASLDLPARSVSLRSGGASREKLLFVAAAAERVGPLLDALAERNSP
ncbi:hypothetical protein HUK83_11405, partial [Endobacter medicaginis]|nr:hypothetical protein [Endobacter medicaginis]